VVKEIDIKHLLSETDGPYLTPEPYRGKINRPAYLKYIIDEISEIKKIDSETVLTVLYQNARNLFRI
jgi:TatD DNase family protein